MICTPTFLPSPPIYDILEEACTEKALHGRQQHHATESRRFRFSRKAYISHRQATANALACRHASNRTIQLAGLTSCRSSIAPLQQARKTGKKSSSAVRICDTRVGRRERETAGTELRPSGVQRNSSASQSIFLLADAGCRSLQQSNVCLSVCLSDVLSAHEYEYIHINATTKMPRSQCVLDAQLFRLQPARLCTTALRILPAVKKTVFVGWSQTRNINSTRVFHLSHHMCTFLFVI